MRARTSDDNVWVNYQLGDLEQGLSEFVFFAPTVLRWLICGGSKRLGPAVEARSC